MVRKGVFRKEMIGRLVESIDYMLKKKGFRDYNIRVLGERIVVEGVGELDRVAKIIASIPGVSSTSPSLMLHGDITSVYNDIVEAITSDLVQRESFRIETSCSLENTSCSSISRYIGYLVSRETGSRIDLVEPDKTYYIDIRGDYVLVTNKVYEGIGGLPYGVEGCLTVLVSGGIDSIVAAWYALKRGCSIIPVFIDMTPYWSREAIMRAYKALELLWMVTPWREMKAYIVHNLPEIIIESGIPDRLKCILCKTLMHTIAYKIALKEGCLGVVTGESIGQVASQTLQNLHTIDSIVRHVVYRPVCFLDKIEITRLAYRLDFSILDKSVGECRLKPSRPIVEPSPLDRELLEKVYSRILEHIDSFLKENAEVIEYSIKG